MAQNTAAIPSLAREAFDRSIELAKQRAARTGENLNDLLDRMDRADHRTLSATNILASGDHATRGTWKGRTNFDVVGGFLRPVSPEQWSTRLGQRAALRA
ncbi:hypothetical protein [Cellulosimicrobium cellulans]|uniref:hypothetical protein n=1 Tax=Cellulosimicrobium cellulans TaxID=1710 RepID=UPI00030960CB|nr:hypothetical protein [Cellulosimicrobium cellulans]MDF2826766.1 hypothetical protein [Mycobacterium sp.]